MLGNPVRDRINAVLTASNWDLMDLMTRRAR